MSPMHHPEEAVASRASASLEARPVIRSNDEVRAWTQLYAAVRDPSTAVEVVKHLNGDAGAKRSHLALYIQASTTLQRHKVATARNQRIGALVRLVVGAIAFGPVRGLRAVWSACRDVTVESLPTGKEPAAPRTRALRHDARFPQQMPAAAVVEAPEDVPSRNAHQAA